MMICDDGLKGADFFTHRVLLENPELSIFRIAAMTNYHPNTVWRALHRLERYGMVTVCHHGRGKRNSYEVKR